jgi:sortase A
MIALLLHFLLAMTTTLQDPTASAVSWRLPTEPPGAWEGGALSIPAIGVDDIAVEAYEGNPDDWPGTRIQNDGRLASPYGGRFSTQPGPGRLGNLIITGHRNTAGGPFRLLPEVARGDRIELTTPQATYVYEVRRSLWISYRSPRDLARQSAPVPGHPGRTPQRSYLTLTTCATQEDHAVGNYWHDAMKNPEHRFVRVAVLVDVRRS